MSIMERSQSTADVDDRRIRMTAVPIIKAIGPVKKKFVHLQTQIDKFGAVWGSSNIADHGTKQRTEKLPTIKQKNIDTIRTEEIGNRNIVAALSFLSFLIVFISSLTFHCFALAA